MNKKMAETETVSVVIPTYYRNEHLKAAIESALNQSYQAVEVIVVDDSGEAHAKPVADDYDGITYIPLDQNRGAQAARTRGIEEASGSYIQLLDDDDRLAPTKFEKQIPLFDDDVGVIYCGFEWDHGGHVLPNADIRGDILEATLRFETVPCLTPTMLIARDPLLDICPLRDRPGADDAGIKIRLARRTQFDFVDEPLVERGSTPDSRGDSPGSAEGVRLLLDEYESLYDQFPPEVRQTALSKLHLERARIKFTEKAWSPAAIAAAAQTCYYAPKATHVAYFLASLFGRPGRTLAKSVYTTVLSGDTQRGSKL